VPVNKISPAVNLACILTIALPAILSVRVWTHHPYQFKLDGSPQVGSPKSLKKLEVSRSAYNTETVLQSVARYGIESCKDFHQNLQAKGHKTFTDLNQAKQELKGNKDVVVSFALIEYVQEPLQYLPDIYDLLKSNGVCYLETDKVNNIFNDYKYVII
jgi:hypothetical protein